MTQEPRQKFANVVLRLLSLNSLSRRGKHRRSLAKRIDNGQNNASTSCFPFMNLPAEIILEVMKVLDICEVLSLSMTSHTLHDLSFSASLWKAQARSLLCHSRPLIISLASPNPTIPTLSALSHSNLRNAVISTSRLSHTWSRQLATCTHPEAITKLSIPLSDPRCVISCVTPHHLLVVSKVREGQAGEGDQELVGWDMEKDRCVGRYRLRETLMSARAEWTTGSCYYVAGRCIGTSTFEFSLIHVQFLTETVPTLSSILSSSTFDSSPSSTSSISSAAPTSLTIDLMSTETLARFAMPFSAEITVHILDVAARMVAVLFECRRDVSSTSTNIAGSGGENLNAASIAGGRNSEVVTEAVSTLGVIVVFDWKTGSSAVIDTGMPFSYPSTTASIHLSPSRENLIAYTDADAHVETSKGEHNFGHGAQKVLSLERLQTHARVWEQTIETAFPSKESRRRSGLLTVLRDDDDESKERNAVEYGWDVSVAAPPPVNERLRKHRSLRRTKTARTRGPGGDVVEVTARDVQGPDELRVGSRRSSDSTLEEVTSASGTTPLSKKMQVPVLDSSTRICMWSRHENWPVFDDMYLPNPTPAIDASSSIPLGPAPARSSRISLHAVPVPKDTSGAAGGRMWYIVQNYVTSFPLPPSSSSSQSLKVPLTIIPLPSPVLKHLTPQQNHLLTTQSWPLLGISFNRVCWIEMLKPRRMSMARVGRRVVRVATFPEPEESRKSGGSRAQACVTTLSIPSNVLRNACHLLLSEVRGTVTVVSNANEVYTYSFV